MTERMERTAARSDASRFASAYEVAPALATVAALVSATVIVALVLFYAFEVSTPTPHVWGPISDMGTAGWNLTAAPLFWGVGTAILGRTRTGRAMCAATAGLSLLGAAGCALLVVRVLPFAESTALSVIVLIVQCVWLHFVGRAMARSGKWRPRTIRAATVASLGILCGAAIVALSFVFGWGSPAQIVVMVVGLVPGLLGWAAWPVWFALLAVDLASAPIDFTRPAR